MGIRVKNMGDLGLANALKDCSEHIIELLQNDLHHEAAMTINKLIQGRDEHVYIAVGQLTRGLHSAIVDFNVDGNLKIEFPQNKPSEIKDASDRLSYVMDMTEKAANRTMDMVEESAPIAATLGEEAEVLLSEWSRIRRREMNKKDFVELFGRVDGFLQDLCAGSKQLNTNMQNIVMEQGFQDLSGQVLKRVIALVKELEDNLVNLVTMASHVELVAGLHANEENKGPLAVNAGQPSSETNSQKGEDSPNTEGSQSKIRGNLNEGFGPQIHPGKHSDVVSGQDEVDELLSSLGF
ncbi:protein phosphatase CheZ [Aurantivibrio infirmus]